MRIIKKTRVHPAEDDTAVLVSIPEEEQEIVDGSPLKPKLEFPNRTESGATHGVLVVYKTPEEQDEVGSIVMWQITANIMARLSRKSGLFWLNLIRSYDPMRVTCVHRTN